MVEFYGYTCGNIQEHTEQKYWTIYGCFELIEEKKAREQVLKLNCHMKNTVFGAKFEWIISEPMKIISHSLHTGTKMIWKQTIKSKMDAKLFGNNKKFCKQINAINQWKE